MYVELGSRTRILTQVTAARLAYLKRLLAQPSALYEELRTRNAIRYAVTVAEPNVLINRAPVLTLWATTVAERFGFDPDEALTLGNAVAGLTAQSKGRRLGIYKTVSQEAKQARARKRGEEFFIEICGRQVPAINSAGGVRAVIKDKSIEPKSVERYFGSKFNGSLDPVRAAMRDLAKTFRPEQLMKNAFTLYEKFRPAIPEGVTGWATKGKLDIERIRSLASEK